MSEIALADVADLVASAGFTASVTAIDRLTAGASQQTYRIELDAEPHRLVLRRSPGERDDSQSIGLLAEAQLLQLATAAEVPVPLVHAVSQLGSTLGEAVLMGWLDGETLGGRIVRSERFADVRPRLAYQCGEVLARIHRLGRGTIALKTLDLPIVSPEMLVRQTWDRYRGYGTAQPMIDFTARWLLDHLPSDREMGVVHGDFRNGNLMIDPICGLVGVLDWELTHIGDPRRDLGWLCTGSWRFGRADLPVGGFGTYDDLFAGYESVSGAPVDRAVVEFWEVFGSFWWSVGCLTMVDTHRQGIDPSSERLAIGRRSSECQADCVNLIIPGPFETPLADPDAIDAVEAPSIAELLGGVADLLGDASFTGAASGRYRYLARVAANSVAIAARDAQLGPVTRAAEQERLSKILERDTALSVLRQDLCARIADDTIDRQRADLTDHLRLSVMAQLAIDQPSYPALGKG